jgi:hypothetical protein
MNEKTDIQKLLLKVDEGLTTDVDLILIGGAAAIIGYNIPRKTADADSWNKIVSHLRLAWEDAEAQTGISCPLSHAGVADAPDFESRLLLYTEIGLKKLNVFVPEAHDLYLMKIMRLLRHDRDDIEALCAQGLIDEGILLQRFKKEMNHVVGQKSKIESNYLLTVFDNFGQEIYESHKRSLAHNGSKQKMDLTVSWRPCPSGQYWRAAHFQPTYTPKRRDHSQRSQCT